jgi:hypothetical protein
MLVYAHAWDILLQGPRFILRQQTQRSTAFIRSLQRASPNGSDGALGPCLIPVGPEGDDPPVCLGPTPKAGLILGAGFGWGIEAERQAGRVPAAPMAPQRGGFKAESKAEELCLEDKASQQKTKQYASQHFTPATVSIIVTVKLSVRARL